MKRFPRLMRTCVVAIVATFVVTTARGQILQQVPSDAMVVFRVKNVQAVSDKAAVLAKQWGLVEMDPAFGDPLGTLLNKSSLTAGVDKGGDMGLILLNHDIDSPEP